MIPLVPLAAVAAGTIATAYTIAIAREARRPRRATFAWALAHGVAPSPAEVPGVRDWHEGATALGGRAGTPGARTQVREQAAPPSAQSIVIPWWAVTGAGEGTLLLVHGWGRSRWDSLRRLPWLLGHARTLLLPDLRGHGEAPGTTSIGHHDHRDLQQVLADAAPTTDPRDLTLVGHSMGAMVVARLAALLAARGTPARRLVLMAPYDALLVPMANRLRVRALPARPFAQLAAAWHARGEEPVHRTLTGAQCPVFVLGGGLDPVTTPDDVRRATAPHEPFIEPGIDHANVGVEGTASRQALNDFLEAT